MHHHQNTAQIKIDTLPGLSSLQASERVECLKRHHLALQNTASIDRLRIETRVLRETEREPMVIRRAKVFAAACAEMPTEILPDELIVGHSGVRPLCRDVIADDIAKLIKGRRLESLMVDTIEYELKDFDPADQKELVEDIAPYWRGNGNWDLTHTGSNIRALPDHLKELILINEDSFPPKQSLIYTPFFISGGHYGHNSISYPEILEKGILGIKEEANEKLASVSYDDPSRDFLEGTILALEAAIDIGNRYAVIARELARNEQNLSRKKELINIAEICEHVPANPARTFHEALQSIFMTQVLLNLESPNIFAQNPGRIDQYLYKYFEEDMNHLRLTPNGAQELLDCYLIKLNHVNRGSHLALGGYRPDGRDATNKLSYMLIESMKHVRLAHPFIGVLLHARTPDEFMIRAAELSALGTGHPVYINADILTTQMLARGNMGGAAVTLQLARTATPVGCYEPVFMGQDSGYMYGGYFNMAAVLELVLTNGYSRHYKRKIGLETGDPRSFVDFEAFKRAYRIQHAFMMKNFSDASNVFERVLAQVLPTPFESSLIKDCISKGKTREDGGARFNFKSVIGAGSTDAGDSLSAIRQLVYEDKKITMDELCQALEDNFEGYECVQQMLNNAPKFGNDDDYADEQVAWVSHVFAEDVSKQENTRGGHAVPMGAPLQYYVFGGWVVGALPSGRKAGQPLSDAWSPCAGCDVNGPTAILCSMGKIDNAELTAGVTLNMRFDPSIFTMRDGFHRFINFVRGLLDQGVFHVQFNMITTATLLQAQKEPEKYRDLIVKVAGYSAYFTQLKTQMQEGIIRRTMHNF